VTGRRGREGQPLFCDTALAERIERAEAQLMADCCAAATDGYVRPLAGGVACFAEPGSPFNKVVGVGFAGVPGVADLTEVQPGSRSQQNAQRQGFDLLYTRAILVKQS
jgi:hypothetical protein